MSDQINSERKAAAEPQVHSSEWLDGETWGCTWAEHKQCREEATHHHPVYGELCPTHAAQVMQRHPKDTINRILGITSTTPK